MPLRKGKAKGKGKGKVKGKGKGKGKKTRNGEKADKESIMKEALVSAKLWETRYIAVDKSRSEYRENTKKLVSDNERLQTAVNQTERDTVEVIAYLKREEILKDQELDSLIQQVKHLKVEARDERNFLIERHSQEISKLETVLKEKNDEIVMVQGELKMVKEFRKRRSEMQQQLDQLQVSLNDSEYDHKTKLSNLEKKFFEEKMRLQKEANRRIADLAENAHAEAVRNLDERTRNVYRENMRMSQALTLHMEHEESLQKSKDQLEMANRQLMAEKELNQQLVQDKISQTRQHKKLIKDLQSKVESLEQSLTVVVQEFEQERKILQQTHVDKLQQATRDLTTIQHKYDLQSREMNHVKRLAKRILDQRSDVERFFLETLSHVRKEIAANRVQYRRDAQTVYQQKMLNAARGKGEFPLVRTFKLGMEQSTNSVYNDMDQAEKWEGVPDQVDIADLTWEQKEQVLRLVFSKINHLVPPSLHTQPLPLPAILPRDNKSNEDVTGDVSSPSAFITQNTLSNVTT